MRPFQHGFYLWCLLLMQPSSHCKEEGTSKTRVEQQRNRHQLWATCRGLSVTAAVCIIKDSAWCGWYKVLPFSCRCVFEGKDLGAVWQLSPPSLPLSTVAQMSRQKGKNTEWQQMPYKTALLSRSGILLQKVYTGWPPCAGNKEKGGVHIKAWAFARHSTQEGVNYRLWCFCGRDRVGVKIV